MSLDPRIILGIQAPQIQSVPEQETRAALMRRQFLEQNVAAYRLQKEQRDAQEMDEMRAIVQEAGGIEQALPVIRQRFPMAAMQLEKEIGEMQRAAQGPDYTLQPGDTRMRGDQVIAQGGPRPDAVPRTRQVTVQGENGPEIRIVEDTPGQVFTPPAPMPSASAPNVGSFEDYVTRRFGQSPTPEQITQARKDYNQADDRPRVSVSVARDRPTPTASLNATRALRNDYTRETRAAVTIDGQLKNMRSSLAAVKAGSSPAGSQGVLVTFQKILDPISVVRESEYARSASGLSLLGRIEGKWEQIKNGGAGVRVSDLEQFVGLAEEFAKNQHASAREVKQQIDGIAKEYGLKPELITREIGDAPGEGAAAAKPSNGLPSYQDYLKSRGQK